MSTSMSSSPDHFIAPVHTPDIAPVPVTFLMCSPKLYDVNYVINPWMAGHVHDSSRTVAMAQWKRLYEAVTQLADVVLVEPQPGSPDMVFTANAGLEHNGVVVLSSFFHAERQGEERHFRRWFQQAGYTVLSLPRETPFEGEGDALFAVDGSRLWAGYGPRTSKSSHHYLSEAWKIEVASLHLIDERFYHLDTCFAPLEGGSVLYYPPAFDQASIMQIEDYYAANKRIVVTEADALRFACNVINIDRTVILNEVSRELSDQLKSNGFRVIEVQLSEFLKAGGAAKCLVMRLSGATH
ncbi:arginine deiminase-related protein [Edaphobacter paludis]|uniref:arginine deiminase n=1 Tax=Edaphobacter paludis TaxID=3035702 RepID=A0AAU7DCF2_9BACT